MKINTVGRIILKDGMLVFERFGAAVARKVKLGTAAFANIVNNLATTEEGFALDARVGPVIDERLSGLETDVESLNSAMRETSGNISLQGGSLASILDAIKAEWNSYPDGVNTGTKTTDGPIAAYIYYKLSNDYGAIIIFSYFLIRPVYITKLNGQWIEAVRI